MIDQIIRTKIFLSDKLTLHVYSYNKVNEDYQEDFPIELKRITDENEIQYIVTDSTKHFCREGLYRFKIDGFTKEIWENSTVLINDDECSDLQYDVLSDRPRKRPFNDSFGAAQIQVKIHKDNNTLCYCSDCYLVESNRKDDINNEADAAITYIAEHYPELFKEDPRISFIGTKLSSRSIAERTLKRQMLENTCKVYEHSYAYMRNSPYTHIRNIDEVVPVSRMQSVTPRTVKYIASHTNCLVPTQKGIKYGSNQYCQPAKVLSEQKERTFDVYENRVVMGFLKTILQEIQSIISDTQKEIDALPESEERNRLEKERDDLIDIRSKYVNTQKKYGDIFRINARALRTLPKPTPALTTTNAYRAIYQEIRKWFNGTFDVTSRETMMKFLATSKLYEYYLLCKMLNSLDNRLLPLYRQEIYNIDYLHGDPDVDPKTYIQTRVADVFKYTNGENELTLYYQPVIKIKNLNSSPDIPLLYRNDAKAKYYMPDYVFKLRNGNSVRYIILDAKYSKPSSYNNGSKNLNEMIEKYICNISCYLPWEIGRINNWYNFKPMAQKKLGMIILCGQQETNNFDYLVNWLDYEQYAVLPAVASAEYNRSSAPNMVDNVVQYVVDSFFQPLNVNGPNKPPITLPDLSFQDYFKKR